MTPEQIAEVVKMVRSGAPLYRNAVEIALLAEHERAERLTAAIRWALGEGDDFPLPPERVPGKPYPTFYWRTELRRRTALEQEAES